MLIKGFLKLVGRLFRRRKPDPFAEFDKMKQIAKDNPDKFAVLYEKARQEGLSNETIQRLIHPMIGREIPVPAGAKCNKCKSPNLKRIEETEEEIVIDDVYFHISNGGLSLSIVHDPPDELTAKGNLFVFSIPHLKVELTCFSIPLTVKIPLGSVEIVHWLHKVAGRLCERMLQSPNDGRHIHFSNDLGKGSKPGHVTTEDGCKCDYKFIYDVDGFHRVEERPENYEGHG